VREGDAEMGRTTSAAGGAGGAREGPPSAPLPHTRAPTSPFLRPLPPRDSEQGAADARRSRGRCLHLPRRGLDLSVEELPEADDQAGFEGRRRKFSKEEAGEVSICAGRRSATASWWSSVSGLPSPRAAAEECTSPPQDAAAAEEHSSPPQVTAEANLHAPYWGAWGGGRCVWGGTVQGARGGGVASEGLTRREKLDDVLVLSSLFLEVEISI
jgi:hypothetical protein